MNKSIYPPLHQGRQGCPAAGTARAWTRAIWCRPWGIRPSNPGSSRSIFDAVGDFLHDDALGGDSEFLTRHLKPDLPIIDDMGIKQLPKRSGECLFEILLRRHGGRDGGR